MIGLEPMTVWFSIKYSKPTELHKQRQIKGIEPVSLESQTNIFTIKLYLPLFLQLKVYNRWVEGS